MLSHGPCRTQWSVSLETPWPIAYTARFNPWKGGPAMFSVANLLDRAKAKANIESDYRLGKVIGITHGATTNYRTGKTMPNDKILAQLCALSGDDVAVVAAQVQAERAQSPEGKTMWLMIAKRLSGQASTAILSVLFTISLIAGYAPPAGASGLNDSQKVKADNLYIASSSVFVRWSTWLELHRCRIMGFFRLCTLAAL